MKVIFFLGSLLALASAECNVGGTCLSPSTQTLSYTYGNKPDVVICNGADSACIHPDPDLDTPSGVDEQTFRNGCGGGGEDPVGASPNSVVCSVISSIAGPDSKSSCVGAACGSVSQNNENGERFIMTRASSFQGEVVVECRVTLGGDDYSKHAYPATTSAGTCYFARQYRLLIGSESCSPDCQGTCQKPQGCVCDENYIGSNCDVKISRGSKLVLSSCVAILFMISAVFVSL